MTRQNESDSGNVEYLVEGRCYNLLFRKEKVRGVFVGSDAGGRGIQRRMVHEFVFRDSDKMNMSAYIDEAHLILEGETVRCTNESYWTLMCAYNDSDMPSFCGIDEYLNLEGILQEAGL